MWRDIRPGGQLSARELNDLADMAEGRIVGVGTGEASNNSVTISRTPTGQAIGFDAPEKLSIKITSASGTGTGGSACYTWTEVYLDATSTTWTAVGDGRTGTLTSLSARERSGDTSVILNSIVEATLDESGEFYLFDAPGSATTSAYKIATIEEVDGSPSYTAISTLRFDSADGFVLSQPGAGIVRVDIAAATGTQAGVVSTTTQTFRGDKTIEDNVTGSTTIAGATLSFLLTTGSKSGVVSVTDDYISSGSSQLNVYARQESSGDTAGLYFVSRDGIVAAFAVDNNVQIDGTFAVLDSTSTMHEGAYASVSGLVFKGGLYISGSLSIDELAQDAVGGILVDSSTIDFTYNDATPSITAIVIDDSITYAKIQNISATSRILGRKTAGSGDTEECTLSQVLDFVGSAAQGDILYRGASDWARLAAGTSGYFLKTQGAGANPTWAAQTGGTYHYILLRDSKTAGTDGGTFTSGAWRTRDLGTELTDTGGNCSLSSNQFTLDAGTYRIRARAPAYRVGQHKAKLYNVSDTNTEIVGSTAYAENAYNVNNYSFIDGQFTIASSKTFEIQHQCQTTLATQGFGVSAGFSLVDIYTVVELWKEP